MSELPILNVDTYDFGHQRTKKKKADPPPAAGPRDIREFLLIIHPEGAWTLSRIWPDGGNVSQTFQDVDEAVAWALGWNEKGWNLYYYPQVLSRSFSGGSPSKADVKETWWGWADVDGPPDDMQRRLLSDDHWPTLVVNSGGGVNGLWRWT